MFGGIIDGALMLVAALLLVSAILRKAREHKAREQEARRIMVEERLIDFQDWLDACNEELTEHPRRSRSVH